MTARDFLRIVREGWAIILATTIVFGMLGVLYTATRTPTFQSTATLSVSACAALENSEACDPVSGISFAVQRASIYASVGTSAPVLRDALERTDAVETRADLASRVTVSQTSDSPLIEVTSTSTSADGAAEIANAVAQALISYAMDSIDNVESDLTRVQFDVISEAVPPLEPMESNRQTIILATAVGILIGLALAFARWLLDTRIRDRRDAEEFTDLDVLAELPIAGRSRAKVVAAVAEEGSSAAEFHQLRTVVSTRLAQSASIIGIIAPGESARATVVAQGLATSFAATRTRVAVLHLHDSAPAPAGAIDLRDLLNTSSAVSTRSPNNPVVISYRGSSSDASIMLGTPEFSEVLARLKSEVDVVLIDASSEGADAEMTGAVRHADSALVLIELGRTRRDELSDALRSLDLVGVRPLGIAAVAKVD